MGGKGVGKNMGKDARGWSKAGHRRRGLGGKVARTVMRGVWKQEEGAGKSGRRDLRGVQS